jgi:single-stranded-DNA-specific exonuclease
MTKHPLNWKIISPATSNKLHNTNLPDWFLSILFNRGINTEAEVLDYLEPDYQKIVKPEMFLGVKEAVDRIKKAKDKDEKIVVYGDYDVDGITATAMMFETMNKIGIQELETYIPHREEEGYGLNREALDEIKAKGAGLVIAVDCGVTAGKLIDSYKELDFIVVDHHSIDKAKLPKRAAILHPSLTKDKKEHNLSGAGMAFIFALALQGAFPRDFLPGQEKWLLDLVALSTICDIVPLTAQNRLLAYWGLIVLNKTKRDGLKALMDVSGVELGSADSYSAGFLLGPRLNAAGRLESAQKALKLLLTDDKKEARELAHELNRLNQERQLLCERIVEEARQKVEQDDQKETPIHLLSDKNWPRGIVGIVASRISDYYNRPAIIFEDDGEFHHGSARSIEGLNITELLSQASDYLVKFGGHAKAAGLTVSHEHFVVFQEKLVSLVDDKLEKIDLARELQIDTTIKPEDIDDEAMALLAKMEPTGYGNKKPVFMMENVTVIDIKRVGKEKEHLKFKIQNSSTKSQTIDAVAFSEPRDVKEGERYDIALTLKYNVWNNRRTIEARIIDFRPHKSK